MSSSCDKCGTGCKCGSDCKCSGCSCCKRNADLVEERGATSGTAILGVAPLKGQFEEGGYKGGENGGCMCGSNCSCNPCTC